MLLQEGEAPARGDIRISGGSRDSTAMHTARMESPKLQSVESTQEREDVEDLGDSMKITSGNGWIAQWQKVSESCRTGNVG